MLVSWQFFEEVFCPIKNFFLKKKVRSDEAREGEWTMDSMDAMDLMR